MNPRIMRLCLLALLLAAVLFSPHASWAQEKETPKLPMATIYYLKQVQAGAVEKLIQELYADVKDAPKFKVVADERTNALLISAPDEIVKQIEDLLKALDAAPAEKPKVIVKPLDEIKVFTLKNASASQSLNVINNLVGAGVQVTADDRTNSLIATGPKKELEMLEALLIRMDQVQTGDSMTLRVYPLKHASPENTVNTLNSLGLGALYSMDTENRRLLVRGDEEVHKAIEEMLQTIDAPKEKPKPQPMQLRIVWLVEEKLAGKDAREPAKNLEKVITVLNDKLGVTNLKMAAQLLVTIDPTKDDRDEPFTAHGTTSLQEGLSVRLEVVGQIIGQEDGKPTIQLSIEASQPDANADQAFRGRSNTPSNRTLTSLTTKVAAPAGHSIVLGMTPIHSTDSVFVLQVLSTEDEPARPSEAPKN